MKIFKAILVASMTLAIIGCDSDDDDDNAPPGGNGGMGEGGGSGEMMGTATLAELVALPLEGAPVDDGLDQVGADIMTLFGDANGEPVSIEDGDTISTIVGRRQQAQ